MSAGQHDELRIVDAYWEQLRAVDDRLLRRARARAHRRRLSRTLAFAVLALLLAAAAALAAKALLFGDDAPRSFPSQASTLGSVRPGETRLLGVRRPDPDGGPVWAVRVSRTTRGQVCLQTGRLVNGRLAALGVAGAFGDDGRAHALPIEQQTCTREASGGGRTRILHSESATRSGLAQSDRLAVDSGCLGPALHQIIVDNPARVREYIRRATARGDAAAVAEGRRRLRIAERRARSMPPVCAEANLRTVIAGLAGANVAAVELEIDGDTQRVATSPSEADAFLFVVTGHRRRPGLLTVEFGDGRRCPLITTSSDRRPLGSACLRAFASKP